MGKHGWEWLLALWCGESFVNFANTSHKTQASFASCDSCATGKEAMERTDNYSNKETTVGNKSGCMVTRMNDQKDGIMCLDGIDVSTIHMPDPRTLPSYNIFFIELVQISDIAKSFHFVKRTDVFTFYYARLHPNVFVSAVDRERWLSHFSRLLTT